MNELPFKDETLFSRQDGFFIEIIEFDQLFALDLQYLTPSSVSLSSASNSFLGLFGISGLGGEFYKGGLEL